MEDLEPQTCVTEAGWTSLCGLKAQVITYSTGRYTDLRQTRCSKAHTVQYITTHTAATGIRAALRCYHSANLMAA